MQLIPITIRLNPSSVDELRLRAEETKLTVTEIARQLIENALMDKLDANVEMLDLLGDIKKLAETTVHLSALAVGVSSIPLNASDEYIVDSRQQTANHIMNGHDIGSAVRRKLEKTMGIVISKELTFNQK